MTQAPVHIQTFAITFLSPVHIGTEEQLDEHDFVYENGHLIRFRITPILERMGEQELERFVNGGLEAVKDWLRQSGLWQQLQLYQSVVPRQPRWNREPVRPFIADPLLRPYLPGTEIKGAIRTAVAWWLLRQKDLASLEQKLRQRLPQHKPSRRELVQAGQWLEQSLLGIDPNHDLLRSLRVQDSTPVEPHRLKVFPVLVAVRTNRGLQWLQSPRSRQESSQSEQQSQYTNALQHAVANFCECLDGSVSGISVTIVCDEFLARGEIERGESKVSVPEELRWEDAKREAVANWQKACNEFAKTVAEWELKWWQQVRANGYNPASQIVAASLERFYADLLQRMGAEGNNAVFFNLGWGGGWRIKTVTELFDDETVQQVVHRYGLDRGAKSQPFPKTRKVAWQGGNGFAPLGWVKLTPL